MCVTSSPLDYHLEHLIELKISALNKVTLAKIVNTQILRRLAALALAHLSHHHYDNSIGGMYLYTPYTGAITYAFMLITSSYYRSSDRYNESNVDCRWTSRRPAAAAGERRNISKQIVSSFVILSTEIFD